MVSRNFGYSLRGFTHGVWEFWLLTQRVYTWCLGTLVTHSEGSHMVSGNFGYSLRGFTHGV